MSLFKTKAIILEIKKQSKENHLYFVFSSDYGKILVTRKMKPKEKNLDIGYNINCEIEVNPKQDIHKIKNIKIINQFNYNDKDYKLIMSYLEMIGILNKQLQTGLVNPLFYEIISKINSLEKITHTKLTLAKLKIIQQLGLLNTNNKEEIITKILNFISENNIEKIALLKDLDENILQTLNKIINSSLND